MQYEGGCHCGNIKFTATGELQTQGESVNKLLNCGQFG